MPATRRTTRSQTSRPAVKRPKYNEEDDDCQPGTSTSCSTPPEPPAPANAEQPVVTPLGEVAQLKRSLDIERKKSQRTVEVVNRTDHYMLKPEDVWKHSCLVIEILTTQREEVEDDLEEVKEMVAQLEKERDSLNEQLNLEQASTDTLISRSTRQQNIANLKKLRKENESALKIANTRLKKESRIALKRIAELNAQIDRATEMNESLADTVVEKEDLPECPMDEKQKLKAQLYEVSRERSAFMKSNSLLFVKTCRIEKDLGNTQRRLQKVAIERDKLAKRLEERNQTAQSNGGTLDSQLAKQKQNELATIVHESENKMKTMQRQFDALDKERQSLQSNYGNVLKQNTDLKTKLIVANDRATEATKAQQAADNKLQADSAEKEFFERKAADLEIQFARATKESLRLKSITEANQKRLQTLEQKFNDADSERRSLRLTNGELQIELTAARNQVGEMTDAKKAADKNTENNSTDKPVIESKLDELKFHFKQVMEKSAMIMEEDKQRLLVLEKELKSANEERRCLLQNNGELKSHSDEAAKEIAKLMTTTEEDKQRLITMEQQMNAAIEERQALLQNNEKLTSQLEQTTKEVAKRMTITVEDNGRLKALEEELNVANEERRSLLQHNGELGSKLTSADEEAQLAAKATESLKSDLQSAAIKVALLSADVDELEGKLSVAAKSKIDDDASLQALLTEKKELQEAMNDSALRENDAFEAKMHDIERQLEAATKMTVQKENECNGLKEEIESIRTINGAFITQLQEATKDNARLTAALKEHRNSVQCAEQELSEAKKEQQRMQINFEERLASANGKTHLLTSKLDSALGENNVFKANIHDIQKKLEAATQLTTEKENACNGLNDELESVQRRNNDLTTQLQEATDQNAKLTAASEVSAIRLRTVEQELCNAEEKQHQMQIDFEKNLEDINVEKRLFLSNLDDANRNLDSALRENNAYQAKIHDIERQLEAATQLAAEKENACNGLKDEIQAAGTKSDDLTNRLQEAAQENANRLRTLEQELCNAEEKQHQMQIKFKKSLEDVNGVLSENDALQTKIHDAERQIEELNGNLAKMAAEKENVSNGLKDEIQAARTKNDNLTNRLQDAAQENANRLRTVEQKLDDTSSKLDSALRENNAFQAKIDDVERQLEEAAQFNGNLAKMATEKENACNGLKDEIQAARTKSDDLTTQLQEATNQNAKLTADLEERATRLTTVEQQLSDAKGEQQQLNTKLEEGLKAVNAEKHMLKCKLSATNAKNKELVKAQEDSERKLKAAVVKYESLKAKALASESRLIAANLNTDNVTKRLDAAVQECNKLKQEIASVEGNLLASKQKHEEAAKEAKNQLRSTSTENGVLKDKIGGYKIKLAAVNSEVEEARKGKQDAEQQLESQSDEYKSMIADLQLKLGEAITTANDAKKTIQSTLAANQLLKTNVADLESKLTAVHLEIQRTTKAKQDAEKSLESSLIESRSRISDLERQLDEVRLMADDTKRTLATNSATNLSLKSTIAELERSLKSAEHEVEEARTARDEAEMNLESSSIDYKSIIASLERQLEEVRLMADDTKRALATNSAANLTLKTTIADLERYLQAAEQECEEVRTARDDAAKVFESNSNEYKSIIASLQSQLEELRLMAADTKTTIETTAAANLILKATVADLQRCLHSAEHEIDEVRTARDDAEKAVKATANENAVLKSQIVGLQSSVRKAHDELEESQKTSDSVYRQLQASTTQNSLFQAQIGAFESKLATVSNELMLAQNNAENRLHAAAIENGAKIWDLENQLAEVRISKNDVEELLHETVTSKDALNINIAGLETSLRLLHNEFDEVKTARDIAQNENLIFRSQIIGLQTQVATFEEQIQEEREDAEDRLRATELKNGAKSLERDHKLLECSKKLVAVSRELREEEDKAHAATTENEELKKKFTGFNERLLSLNQEVQDATKATNNAENQLLSVQSENRALRKQSAYYENKLTTSVENVRRLTRSQAEASARLRTAATEIEDLKESIASLDKANQDMQEDLVKEEAEQKKRQEQCDAEKAALRDQLKDACDNAKELERNLQNEIASLQKEKFALLKSLEDLKAEHEQELESANKQFEIGLHDAEVHYKSEGSRIKDEFTRLIRVETKKCKKMEDAKRDEAATAARRIQDLCNLVKLKETEIERLESKQNEARALASALNVTERRLCEVERELKLLINRENMPGAPKRKMVSDGRDPDESTTKRQFRSRTSESPPDPSSNSPPSSSEAEFVLESQPSTTSETSQ